MASIFTGLAFMHGHIVDRELLLKLGRDDRAPRMPVRVPDTSPEPPLRENTCFSPHRRDA